MRLKTKYLNLATTTTLTTFENKISNVSNLIKKTDYNTKISEIKNKIATDSDHDNYILLFKNLIIRKFYCKKQKKYI